MNAESVSVNLNSFTKRSDEYGLPRTIKIASKYVVHKMGINQEPPKMLSCLIYDEK